MWMLHLYVYLDIKAAHTLHEVSVLQFDGTERGSNILRRLRCIKSQVRTRYHLTSHEPLETELGFEGDFVLD